MKTIIFIAGTKGGVGKTTFALYLSNAAADLGIGTILYDNDSENKTLCNLCPDAVFLDDTFESYPLDLVINSALAEDDAAELAIVDMKAGTSRSIQDWFQDVPWDLLQENKIRVYIAGCITADPDSVRTFLPWLTKLSDKEVSFIISKNEKEGQNFSFFEENIETILKKSGCPIFTIRETTRYQAELNNLGMTLHDTVLGNKALPGRTGKMELSRMRSYYNTIVTPIRDFLSTLYPEANNPENSK